MRALFAAAAVLFAATPALAQEPAQQRFTHEGQTYTYTVRQAGDRQVIDGRGNSGRFHLVVRGNTVSGTAAGYPVSFKTTDAVGAAGSVEVVAR